MNPRRRRPGPFDWSTALVTVLVVSAATAVYVRDGRARFLAILADDFGLFVDMLPKVLAGCLIGVFVTLLLPREVVARWVGAESGFSGMLIATIAGAILPGGPFTVYPVAGAFVAMQDALLGQSQRQFAITAPFRAEYQHRFRAVHRLERVLGVLFLRFFRLFVWHYEHIFFIVLPVA